MMTHILENILILSGRQEYMKGPMEVDAHIYLAKKYG